MLVGLENPVIVAKKIVEKKLSVRQTESLVKFFKGKKTKNKSSKDPNILEIETSLKDKLGLRVFIKNKKNNSGILTFEYKDSDQLNRIIDIIKWNY